MKKISFKFGFTLIELMVVIAIIALLTAIITSNLAQSKAKARDGKRVSDLAQIQLALELFFDRCNAYPPALDVASGKNSSNPALEVSSCPTGITLGTYIAKIPTETNGSSYAYQQLSSGLDYIMGAQLELPNPSLKDSADGNVNGIPCNTGNFYCVTPK